MQENDSVAGVQQHRDRVNLTVYVFSGLFGQFIMSSTLQYLSYMIPQSG